MKGEPVMFEDKNFNSSSPTVEKKLHKLLPPNTRFHYNNQNLEISIESLSFGDSHLYAFIGTLIFSSVCILHIPNKCISISFASIPLTHFI